MSWCLDLEYHLVHHHQIFSSPKSRFSKSLLGSILLLTFCRSRGILPCKSKILHFWVYGKTSNCQQMWPLVGSNLQSYQLRMALSSRIVLVIICTNFSQVYGSRFLEHTTSSRLINMVRIIITSCFLWRAIWRFMSYFSKFQQVSLTTNPNFWILEDPVQRTFQSSQCWLFQRYARYFQGHTFDFQSKFCRS